MLLRTKGIPHNINEMIVGPVTRNTNSLHSDSILIIDGNIELNSENVPIITTLDNLYFTNNARVCSSVTSLDHLAEGDVIAIENDGNINTLYRVNSFHNTLFTTERCNSNCIMCSQPPKNKDDIERLFEINNKLINFIPNSCLELGVSGGEPTLMGERFFELIENLKNKLPETEIHVLTNGRTFAWNHMAERLGKIDNKRLILGVPLYSDFYQVHDYIVQAEHAFYQTVLGLHNLARYDQRIEIRVVLHLQSIPRLEKLAQYIFKNLPFVEHVAFMGLEYIGYTPHNIDKLWIDPYDYQLELKKAVEYLAIQGLNVSIYNTPLCVLPESMWQFARKSISDWKNEYLPECNECSKLAECGGLFRWNLKKHSEHIKPFK